MADSDIRTPELWVGFVNDVPLVGTSANMVDGFIALLQGNRKIANAKGYNDFIESAGIREVSPGSIFQDYEGRTVFGCSPEVSESIKGYIIQAVTPEANATIRAAEAATSGADLNNRLAASFKLLGQHGVDLRGNVDPNQRYGRIEHVFNNDLLGLCESIIDLLIKSQVTSDSDAIQGHASYGDHIKLTADHTENISNWVVHIPEKMVYIPINNILFGYMIKSFRSKAAELMRDEKRHDEIVKVLDILFRTVDWIVRHRNYLNPQAAGQWFAEKAGCISQFDRTEYAVQEMLKQLPTIQTCYMPS